MELSAIKLIILDNYKMIIKYNTGETKYIDLKNIIMTNECWKELKDESTFKQAYIDDFGDAPCWPNHNLDMDPVKVYNTGITIHYIKKKINMPKLIKTNTHKITRESL